jgi:hypothetical protein
MKLEFQHGVACIPEDRTLREHSRIRIKGSSKLPRRQNVKFLVSRSNSFD